MWWSSVFIINFRWSICNTKIKRLHQKQTLKRNSACKIFWNRHDIRNLYLNKNSLCRSSRFHDLLIHYRIFCKFYLEILLEENNLEESVICNIMFTMNNKIRAHLYLLKRESYKIMGGQKNFDHGFLTLKIDGYPARRIIYLSCQHQHYLQHYFALALFCQNICEGWLFISIKTLVLSSPPHGGWLVCDF